MKEDNLKVAKEKNSLNGPKDKFNQYFLLSVVFHLVFVFVLSNLGELEKTLANTDSQQVAMSFVAIEKPVGEASKNKSQTAKSPKRKPIRDVEATVVNQRPIENETHQKGLGSDFVVTTKSFNENIASSNYLPKYPPIALRRGWEGKVLLAVTVGPDGGATKVQILKPSEFDALNRSARVAASQWKFKPDQNGNDFKVEKEIVFAIR